MLYRIYFTGVLGLYILLNLTFSIFSLLSGCHGWEGIQRRWGLYFFLYDLNFCKSSSRTHTSFTSSFCPFCLSCLTFTFPVTVSLSFSNFFPFLCISLRFLWLMPCLCCVMVSECLYTSHCFFIAALFLYCIVFVKPVWESNSAAHLQIIPLSLLPDGNRVFGRCSDAVISDLGFSFFLFLFPSQGAVGPRGDPGPAGSPGPPVSPS